MPTLDKYIARAQWGLLYLAGFYVIFVCLLTVPSIQRHALYLHVLRWPLFADLSIPTKYGMPVHRTLNVVIETSDRVKLGAWLLLPEALVEAQVTNDLLLPQPPSPESVSASIVAHPTIILFHGNGATRAARFRLQHCASYSRAFGANVLAIDYRGFADSEGTPSEVGLIRDARAGWDWLQERGAQAENILLVGMSLGTGVATGLSVQLAREGIKPRGLVLLAPFTSIADLLQTYHLFGVLPILQPLQPIPKFASFLTKFLQTRFETASTICSVSVPILIVHSRDDMEIPASHSQKLFDTLLEPFLPLQPPLPTSISDIDGFDWTSFQEAVEERRKRRAALVITEELEKFGTINQFIRRMAAEDDFHKVVFVESLWGGHNRIGLQETVIDLLGAMFF